jgi:hypothetical protein
MSVHRSRYGKIAYLSMEPEDRLNERGRENFQMSFHADGRRTMTAVCEIDDAPRVLRHVTMTYDRDWRPSEAFMRIDVAGQFMGSGWFDITAKAVTLEGRNARSGRLSHRLDLEEPIHFFGCDALVSDGWHMSNFDLEKGPGKQHTKGVLSSADHRGGTGPTIWHMRTGMVFVGPEPITVAAGRFDALHFQIVDTAGEMLVEHAPYDIWTTADGDYITLRSDTMIEGLKRRYELIALSENYKTA